jgi:hypothetical protein
MALLFDAGAHEYFLDGPKVPSNTQVLRDSGLIQLDGIPSFVLEKALQRGSAVHELVHFLNENDLDWASVDPTYRPYLDAWVSFREQRALRIDLCEFRVASRKHRVAGTLDCLGLLEGDGALIDYKTGNPEDVAADFQTAGYVVMAQEWAQTDTRLAAILASYPRLRRFSVRLRRDGSFKVKEYTDVRDYSRFLTLVSAWHIRQERGAIVQPDDIAA